MQNAKKRIDEHSKAMQVEIEKVDLQLKQMLEMQLKFCENILKEEVKYNIVEDKIVEDKIVEDKEYSLAELDQLKSENYVTISNEGDLNKAISRVTFDKNFR